MYHIVCPSKQRRTVLPANVDAKLKEVCDEIQKRYEIKFLEIGSDAAHAHFLAQSVPLDSPKQIVQIIKSLMAREIFKGCPQVKQYLRGGKFWAEGYARQHRRRARGNEQMIKNYVQQQSTTDDNGQFRLF